ncbi:aminotransferase class I/II-fold pyridoxal phosphate-dependent enzyme [Pleomorphovibrio marinus]|uniref:aminotransferase class I/II-fold pyridoxal phosphate-dependent enzyme n=1 Tax=Pleomorphovibrio marinus TaxID=2164132 RepID=UPI000E0C0597|nr:aminotransferase class I/II-fold pyridoxal phosphate-dependent enzyme [Pleomorphovibrio marinus]
MQTFHTSRLGRKINVGSKEYLHFSGTAYLGMANQSHFEEKLMEGIKLFGGSHGSSRNSTVQLGIFEEFEREFAKKAGAEDSICVSSGYLSGLLCTSYLKSEYDQIWVAPGSHPAILPQGMSGDPRGDFSQWAGSCVSKSQSLIGQRILIISNAVNALHPEIHDFGWVNNLSYQNKYCLLIDDSHAFGTIPSGIYGTFASWNHLNASLIVCGSLAKAIGLPGGIVLSDKATCQKLREMPMFRGASPSAPAFLHAFIHSKETYKEQWEKLRGNILWVKKSLGSISGVHPFPEFPVLSFKEAGWVKELEKQGIIVSSFPYPSMQDPTVNRAVISAEHTEGDLTTLVNAFRKLSEKLKK